MVRTKQTARKSTGPRGVPRRRLARRNDNEAGGSQPPQYKDEEERLSAELLEATRERALGVVRIGFLENKIKRITAKAQETQKELEEGAEVLGAELRLAYRNRRVDHIRLRQLTNRVRALTATNENADRMMAQLVHERNAAWQREDAARERVHELEFYVEDLEEYNTNLHEEVHRLRYPHVGAAEGEDGTISDGELDEPVEEEPEDPEGDNDNE